MICDLTKEHNSSFIYRICPALFLFLRYKPLLHHWLLLLATSLPAPTTCFIQLSITAGILISLIQFQMLSPTSLASAIFQRLSLSAMTLSSPGIWSNHTSTSHSAWHFRKIRRAARIGGKGVFPLLTAWQTLPLSFLITHRFG